MRTNRPYLLRAFYDWIVDNGVTPHILVDAQMPGVEVPQEHIEDGKIVLNIAPTAVRDLNISNQLVEFNASFSGQVSIISVPVRAVLAIYAQENGRGMVFSVDEDDDDGQDEPLPPSRSTRTGKPKLTVVK